MRSSSPNRSTCRWCCASSRRQRREGCFAEGWLGRRARPPAESSGVIGRSVPPRAMCVRSSPILRRIRRWRTNWGVVKPPRRSGCNVQAQTISLKATISSCALEPTTHCVSTCHTATSSESQAIDRRLSGSSVCVPGDLRDARKCDIIWLIDNDCSGKGMMR
jgi:hypothetical protein